MYRVQGHRVAKIIMGAAAVEVCALNQQTNKQINDGLN